MAVGAFFALRQPDVPNPSWQVSAAFGIDPTVAPAAGDWVDLSAYLSSINGKTGREDRLSQVTAGTYDLVLDNSDGRFDPDNTSGPYYPNVKPLTWFRIKGGAATASEDVFYGHVAIEGGWRLSASQHPDSTVAVRLVDASEWMANADLPDSVYAIEIAADAPALWARLGDKNGTRANDSSGNENHGTYLSSAVTGTAGDGSFTAAPRLGQSGAIVGDDDSAALFEGYIGNNDATDAGGVVFPLSAGISGTGDFSVELWFYGDGVNGKTVIAQHQEPYWSSTSARRWRFHRTGDSIAGGPPWTTSVNFEFRVYEAITGSSTAATWTIEAGTHTDLDAVPPSPLEGRWNHFVGTRSAETVRAYLNGVEVDNTVGAATRDVGPGYVGVLNGPGTVDEIAVYSSALSAARVLEHYEAGSAPWEGETTSARVSRVLDVVGFPASLRNIETGELTMQSTSLASTADQLLADAVKAEGGEGYIDHQDGGNFRFRSRSARYTAAASTTSQVTFGDGAGEVTCAKNGIALDDDKIINTAIIQRANGPRVAVEDLTGTLAVVRSYSETGLQYEDDTESQPRGERIVSEHRDRKRRVRSIVLEPRKSTHLAWAQVFARKTGDRITVKWRPPYGGTYEFVCWIEGIAHSWTAATGLRTTFYLSPVPHGSTDAVTAYWIAGVSRAGVDTRAF